MMFNIDPLTLIAGVDIPIPSLGVSLHQPTLKEIALIGEKDFYQAAQTIVIKVEDVKNTKTLSHEDNIAVSQLSNFELFLKLVEGDALTRVRVLSVFALLFPDFSVEIEDRFVMMVNPTKGTTLMLTEEVFDELQDIVSTVLCLHPSNQKGEYNPVGDKAKEIAEKLKRGREKAARLKGETPKNEGGILSKYISGLGIGTQSLKLRDVLELTLYQLFDQLERFSLFSSYEIAIKAKMAGAEGVEDVDWLKNIH